MNILSWNVNGIRSIHRKNLFEGIFSEGFGSLAILKGKFIDIIGLQETKASYCDLDSVFFPEKYSVYHNSATEKKGYSGTVIFVLKSIESKQISIPVTYETLRTEGRLVCVEVGDHIIINGYFPNGGGKPERLDYKLRFYDEFIRFCSELLRMYKKKIVFFGDLNIGHHPIDLARPKENEKNVGFLPVERERLDILHKNGFFDLFRFKYPDRVAYTWWDMKTRARERNVGWRIDSFYGTKLVSDETNDVFILDNMYGSDHCPILLSIKD